MFWATPLNFQRKVSQELEVLQNRFVFHGLLGLHLKSFVKGTMSLKKVLTVC